jgi:hypothetical protein
MLGGKEESGDLGKSMLSMKKIREIEHINLLVSVR